MSRKYSLQTLMIFSLLIMIVPHTYGQIYNPSKSVPTTATSTSPRLGPKNLPLTAEQKKLVAGSAEDHAKYAAFLKQSGTGLFRLFPRVDYETFFTVDAQAPEHPLAIRGGGAYYSFGNNSHIFGPWSDICLQDNALLTQVASISMGLFTVIGDVPLDSVTLQTPGVEFLTKMPVPSVASDVGAQVKRNNKGFQEGEFPYRSEVRVSPNLTYILRSVIYKRPDFFLLNPRTGATLSSPNVYQSTDLLVAFRVVRQEEDGTVTILWKRLKKSSVPQLKMNKK